MAEPGGHTSCYLKPKTVFILYRNVTDGRTDIQTDKTDGQICYINNIARQLSMLTHDKTTIILKCRYDTDTPAGLRFDGEVETSLLYCNSPDGDIIILSYDVLYQ